MVVKVDKSKSFAQVWFAYIWAVYEKQGLKEVDDSYQITLLEEDKLKKQLKSKNGVFENAIMGEARAQFGQLGFEKFVENILIGADNKPEDPRNQDVWTFGKRVLEIAKKAFNDAEVCFDYSLNMGSKNEGFLRLALHMVKKIVVDKKLELVVGVMEEDE